MLFQLYKPLLSKERRDPTRSTKNFKTVLQQGRFDTQFNRRDPTRPTMSFRIVLLQARLEQLEKRSNSSSWSFKTFCSRQGRSKKSFKPSNQEF